jgi:hypothetical protein
MELSLFLIKYLAMVTHGGWKCTFMLPEIQHYMEASSQLYFPAALPIYVRRWVWSRWWGRWQISVPVWNRSPKVQALSVTELFGYKPVYSHFDFRPGQVSLLWLRVQWLFWCLATVMDSVVLTVNLVFWSVMQCSLIVRAFRRILMPTSSG